MPAGDEPSHPMRPCASLSMKSPLGIAGRISKRKHRKTPAGRISFPLPRALFYLLLCGISVLRSVPLPRRGNRDFHPRVLGIRLCFSGRYSVLWFAFRSFGGPNEPARPFSLLRFSAFSPLLFCPSAFRFLLFAYLSAAARIRREWGRMAGNGMWEKG